MSRTARIQFNHGTSPDVIKYLGYPWYRVRPGVIAPTAKKMADDFLRLCYDYNVKDISLAFPLDLDGSGLNAQLKQPIYPLEYNFVIDFLFTTKFDTMEKLLILINDLPYIESVKVSI